MAEPSLELLMQMVQKVLDHQRVMREDVREVKTRLCRLESEGAGLHGFLAVQSVGVDRFAGMDRRSELSD